MTDRILTQKHRALWKAHGGSWHGPRVETWTMPEANIEAFLRDLLATPVIEPQHYVEITEEMITAGRKAADDQYYKWRGFGPREEGQGLDGMHSIVREALKAARATAQLSVALQVPEVVAFGRLSAKLRDACKSGDWEAASDVADAMDLALEAMKGPQMSNTKKNSTWRRNRRRNRMLK